MVLCIRPLSLTFRVIYPRIDRRNCRGSRLTNPEKRLGLLLLCSQGVGLPSSRMIEKACLEDAAIRMLNRESAHGFALQTHGSVGATRLVIQVV